MNRGARSWEGPGSSGVVAGTGFEPATSGFYALARRLVVTAEYAQVVADLRWRSFLTLAFRRIASVRRNAATHRHDLSRAA